MAKAYDATPRDNIPVETKYRKMACVFPHPEASALIEKLRSREPVSMTGQPPVIWDRAQGINVFDRWGNKWLDMTSCVVVANAGHSNPQVGQAITDTVSQGLLSSYCFPNDQRMKLVERICELSPEPLGKVFLLTTGSETTECAIKLCRTYGLLKYGAHKIKIITFDNAFHGRTMGSQQAGGSSAGKAWIVNFDKDIVQVPFPNAFLYEWADESRADYSDDRCFDMFLAALREQGVRPEDIAGVMSETFQGGWVQMMPKGFVQRLRAFCDRHDILMAFDEIQAGFGRTGKLFGFQHYDVAPDLVCCGKGISSSLPISCVIGRQDVMDLYGPAEMTSTHSGNPVCSAAALASIDYIVENKLPEHAAKMGKIFGEGLEAIRQKYAGRIGVANSKGLVGCLITVKPGTKEPDPDLAYDVVLAAVKKGLLLFAPVGNGAAVKLCPPLIIEEEPLREALDVLDEAFAEVLAR